MEERTRKLSFLGVLFLHAVILVTLATVHRFDFNPSDEPYYFGGGSVIRHLGVANQLTLGHPPLALYLNSLLLGANPVDWSRVTDYRQEAQRTGDFHQLVYVDSIGEDLVRQTEEASRSVPWLFLRGRIGFILLSLSLAWILYRILRNENSEAALPVASVFALCPLVLSTAPAIMNDFTMTCFASLAALSLAAWSEGLRHRYATLAGLLIGLALGSKMSALLLIPIGGVAALRGVLLSALGMRKALVRATVGTLLAGGTAFLTLWTLYGFQVDSLKNIEKLHHTYPTHERLGQTFPTTRLESQFPRIYAMPLPAVSVLSSLRWAVHRTVNNGAPDERIEIEGPFRSWKEGHTYPWAIIATYFPLGFLLLVIAAACFLFRQWRISFVRSRWWLVGLWPAAHGVVAFLSPVQLGPRYFFPIFPLALLTAALAIGKLASSRTARAIFVSSAGLTVFELFLYLVTDKPWSLWVFPVG